MWVVVYFALVEHLLLESKHKISILALVRFIDDMLVIWKDRKRCPCNWKNFK